jgi:Na+-driven multidrug efflux pump
MTMLDDRGTSTETGPPVVPLVMLAVTTSVALVMVAVAALEGAGDTNDISLAALLGWVFGSVLGLLLLAWFGWLDAGRRSTGRYVEPEWRPRTIGVVLAVSGWLIGSFGAFLVAQAIARR